jgi:AdoMet-dependent heme synthase
MAHAGHHLLQKLAQSAGIPSGAHLQIADRCNHACRHCYQVQGRKGEMSLDEIKAVLDDLAASGLMLLNISGGEATLRHDLLDVMRYARSKGFALRLFTNGYSMTAELAAALRELPVLGVDVSIYSDDPAQHDDITRVPGSHARTVAGVRLMVEAGLRVHLKVPATSIVPDAGARVRRLAASIDPALSVVTSYDITPMETGELATRALSPDPEEVVRIGAVKGWSPPADRAALDEVLLEGLADPTCGACREGVAILSNGDVRPCTDIVAPIGNLRERRFLELYSSPGPQLVRSITWKDIHGCRDCEIRPACERCHASASHEDGDLLGPYAGGCATAVARYKGGVGEVSFLAPDDGCEPGRAATRGPFRIASPGVLQAVPDVVTAQDAQRRLDFPWLRPDRRFLEESSWGDRPAARRSLPVVGQARAGGAETEV